mmetsp:Transcript_13094/g.29871  ORF Transcript_13094/g.29871 Transcript_13094/m.29871 type:complete len:283 (+) Transcript_13094:1753-2601(+)
MVPDGRRRVCRSRIRGPVRHQHRRWLPDDWTHAGHVPSSRRSAELRVDVQPPHARGSCRVRVVDCQRSRHRGHARHGRTHERVPLHRRDLGFVEPGDGAPWQRSRLVRSRARCGGDDGADGAHDVRHCTARLRRGTCRRRRHRPSHRRARRHNRPTPAGGCIPLARWPRRGGDEHRIVRRASRRGVGPWAQGGNLGGNVYRIAHLHGLDCRLWQAAGLRSVQVRGSSHEESRQPRLRGGKRVLHVGACGARSRHERGAECARMDVRARGVPRSAHDNGDRIR